jgi:hypothetical protein
MLRIAVSQTPVALPVTPVVNCDSFYLEEHSCNRVRIVSESINQTIKKYTFYKAKSAVAETS